MSIKLSSLNLVILFWAGTLPAEAPELEVKVMSSGGFSAAYRVLSREFSEQTHIDLETVYGASMGGAPTSIPSRLGRGEPADVVILASEGLENLIVEGYVVASSRVDLASSLIGMAVHALLEHLSSPESSPVIARTGMTPQSTGR